jgi:hypothetical protein
MPSRCHRCGGTFERFAREGRTTRYNAMIVEIPAGIKLWECRGCETMAIGPEDAEIITEAARQIYETVLKERCRNLIDGLASYRTQWSIEWLLGLSHGYLSKIKSGQRVPSSGLVSALVMLSVDPEARFAELESFWGTGDLDLRYREMRAEHLRDEDGTYHIPKTKTKEEQP